MFLSPRCMGFLVGKGVADNGTSTVLSSFPFHSLSLGISTWTSDPCLTLEDFQAVRVGEEISKRSFFVLNRVIYWLKIWIFSIWMCSHFSALYTMLRTRDTEKAMLLLHSWIYSKGIIHLYFLYFYETCRSVLFLFLWQGLAI